ncbi:hypothetical protein [Aureimonas sp. ME7]|uniref:hypothetical protein n=1 Tax=Aureimonas sp. ME7 TaxID=2744252 RepID=UPI0015FAC9D9|nr:hypothetical protein [Aureimonas sp. ME7]
MVHVANTSHVVQRLNDRAGKLHELEPGEHANIDIDKDDPHVAAKVNALLITVGGTEKQAEAAAAGGVVVVPPEPKTAAAAKGKAATADEKSAE